MDILATLDDGAATYIENECASTVPTINGSFRPNNPLSVFNGENTQGVWQITVFDSDASYTGTLNSWGIEYEYELSTSPLDVTLDATGNATINAEDLLFSVDVECGTYTVLAGNPLASTVSFSCADIGLKTVTVQVTNAGGAASTCIATVNIIDGSGGGSLECPLDIVQPTDPGVCGAVVTYVVDAPVACGGGGTLTQTAGLASGSTFPSGTTTNSFEYDDGINPIQTCSFDITINDNEMPVAVCKNITIQLDANGNASIGTSDINNGSSDNCGIVSMSLSKTNFTCADVGDNNVSLTVRDANGNTDTCIAIVTVEDNFAPTAICQNITVQLDANGTASINAADVDGGSTDACGIDSLSVSPSTFTCADVGANNVTLTVTDINGNVSTCVAVVTVEDNVSSTAIWQKITIQFDSSGNATINAADVDCGSTDACGIDSLSVSPSTFTCADIGANNVTLTVTDLNGNVSTCVAVVTVEDNVSPTAICQDITVQLDSAGNATITAADVDGGSTDACGIDSLTVSPSTFTCADVGANNVTLTVTDINGNVSTCVAVVTVEDNIVPTAVCQNITVQLDGAGNVSITAADVDGGSFDTCGIDFLSVSPSTFTCADLGANNVTLTVTDINGNISTCVAVVNVIDSGGGGSLTCPGDIIQDNDLGICGALVSYTISTPTGCSGGGSLTQTSGLPSGSTFPIGTTTNTFEYDDGINPIQTCSFNVTINDNELPVALCKNITVQLDANGNTSISAADIDNGSTDNCGIANMTISRSAFTCADIGANNVTLTITDINGKVSTCTSIVTVEDGIAPTAVCQNITVHLDGTGNVSITAADVDGGSSDACGIDSLSVSPSTFTCADIGANNVTLTLTDINGNVSTCVAVVTVEDNVSPTAICQDITFQLDSAGNATITAADVDGGSTDACGIDSLTVSPSTFTCADVGANNVTLTVTDINGNVSTCVAVVTVEDNIVPTAVCQNITVQLDGAGNVSITAADVDGGSFDTCGIDFLSVSPSTFTCADLGANNVTLTVTDINGNISTCVAVVNVIDSGGGGSLTCPGDIIQDNDLGICGALVSYTISTPTGCSGGGSLTQTSGLPSGSIFPIGTTTNTFEYDDGINPIQTCSFNVTINDNEL